MLTIAFPKDVDQQANLILVKNFFSLLKSCQLWIMPHLKSCRLRANSVPLPCVHNTHHPSFCHLEALWSGDNGIDSLLNLFTDSNLSRQPPT